jgi:hypothetical protein
MHSIAILSYEETPPDIDLHADKMRPAESGQRVVKRCPAPGKAIEIARTKPSPVVSGARTATSEMSERSHLPEWQKLSPIRASSKMSKRSHLPEWHRITIQMAAEPKMSKRSHLPEWQWSPHDRDPMTALRKASARRWEAHP